MSTAAPMMTASGLAWPNRLNFTNLTLMIHQLVLVVGPNGAGKTSLINSLSGAGGARGSVMIGGLDLAHLPPAARIGLISLMPAERETAWPLAVRDYVSLGLGGRRDEAAIDAMIAAFDLGDLADRRMDRLSTGERARAMLASALVAKPKLALLDEPVAHLDPARQIQMLERLRDHARDGAAVVASIHDLLLARHFADRIIVMQDGAIVADGPPETALCDETIERVFGVSWSAEHGWQRAGIDPA